MAPTPQSVDAATMPGSEDRTRRNVACVNCRNSKVRCKASQVAGQPCQRCAKLGVKCIVDKSHKRVTRRSKLDQLEQELQSIKQAVHPKADGPSAAPSAWTPLSPRAVTHPGPPEQQSPAPVGSGTRPPSADRSSLGPPPPAPGRPKSRPTDARILGSLVVSGEDIDWYFIKFLQCYHSYMPILRKKDPDECFAANATLFWTVICVASRRYPRDGAVFATVADHVGREVWVMMSAPALGLEAVHALLLLCTWPLPGIRFVTDPSSTFAAVALNAAKLLGCHVGRGANPHFIVGLRQHMHSSDEEASSTWLACCMLAQRSASSIGIPPPSIQLADDGPKRALQSHRWTDLLAVYEAQRFLNRFHAAMAAQLCGGGGGGGGVPEAVVAMWETDFEALRPLLVRFDTDLSRFCLLAAQLEILTYYFIIPSPSSQTDGSSLRRNTARALATSRALVTLALALESRVQLLTHAPQWVLRSVVDAAAVIVVVLAHPSSSAEHVDGADGDADAGDGGDADALVRQACAAMLRCSVREADLAHRGSVLMETFWTVRHLITVPPPPYPHGPAPSAWPDRLGAGVTFWCLERFRLGLRAAQSSTDRVNRALDLLQPNRPNAASANDDGTTSRILPVDATTTIPTATAAGTGTADSTLNALTQQAAVQPGSDPFHDVDWSMFMDEFGWTGEDAVFLGLP